MATAPWRSRGRPFDDRRLRRVDAAVAAHRLPTVAAVEPQFVYRHKWRLHDAVLWDNRCTMHCATEFDEERYDRLMYRTTLEGEVPV